MIPKIETKGAYKNINIKGMEEGDVIIVEKLFFEGKKVPSKFQKEGQPEVFNYGCKVKYLDEDVSFFLSEKDHEAFKNVGEVGSKIRITAHEEKYVWNKQKKIRTTYTFEEVTE